MCGLAQSWLPEGWSRRVKHSPDSTQHLGTWLTQAMEYSLEVIRMDLLLFLALSKHLVLWSLSYHTLPISCLSQYHTLSCPLVFHTSPLTFPRPSIWSHNHSSSGGSPCAPIPPFVKVCCTTAIFLSIWNFPWRLWATYSISVVKHLLLGGTFVSLFHGFVIQIGCRFNSKYLHIRAGPLHLKQLRKIKYW